MAKKDNNRFRKVFYGIGEGGHSGRNETFLCIFEKNIF